VGHENSIGFTLDIFGVNLEITSSVIV